MMRGVNKHPILGEDPILGGGREESVFMEYVEGFKNIIIYRGYSGSRIMYHRTVYVIMNMVTHLHKYYCVYVRNALWRSIACKSDEEDSKSEVNRILVS